MNAPFGARPRTSAPSTKVAAISARIEVHILVGGMRFYDVVESHAETPTPN
jgi:hypothetical protein